MADLDVPDGSWRRGRNGHVLVDDDVGERLWREARARRDLRRAAIRDVEGADSVLRAMIGDGMLLRTRSRFVVARLEPGVQRRFDRALLQQETGLDPARFMTEHQVVALTIPRSWEKAA